MLNIGVIGCGAIGRDHIRRLTDIVPGCQVVACADYFEESANKVAAQYEGMKAYKTGEELIHAPEVQAVVITSSDPSHAGYVLEALKAGKYVFCEKPLGTDVEQCKAAEKVIEAHPDLIFQLGFMRRFDKSYAEAKRKIDNGDIGKVVLVRSYTQDPRSTIESTLKFAPHSGGQYLDMCVHDIDLIRWFTGSNVKNVWAIGGVFEFDLYKELNDADNAAATIQMENGAMGFMFTNRTHAAGSNVETEIIGTHGTLRIANVGAKNLLNIVDEHGSREEYYPDFMSRWHEAFVAEMVAFTGHVRDNTKPADLTVYDGTAVSEAAYRCKESFETGKMLPIR